MLFKNITTLSTDRFTWIKDKRMFVVEASDLKGDNIFCHVYDDACDAGFILESSRTGERRYMIHHNSIFDDEGDLQFYVFEPYKVVGHHLEHTTEFTMHIFND